MSRGPLSVPPAFMGPAGAELRLVQGGRAGDDEPVERLRARLGEHAWIRAVGEASGELEPAERALRRSIGGRVVEVRWVGDEPIRRAVVELALDEAEARAEASALRDEGAELAARFEEVQRRLVAQRQVAALGTMASSVAHDIRSPLAVLVSNMGFLEQELTGRVDTDLAGTLEDSRTALEVIEGVLDTMRTFVEGDGRSAMIRLRPPIDSAVRLTRLHFSRARVRLAVDVSGDPVGRASDAELCQILMNLLGNAAEASPEGSTVRLTVRRTREHAFLWVTDEGDGVPAGAEETVFAPFHTSKPHGMGLGLAIAREMAQRHGGELRVLQAPPAPVSPAPQGACFELRLSARL